MYVNNTGFLFNMRVDSGIYSVSAIFIKENDGVLPSRKKSHSLLAKFGLDDLILLENASKPDCELMLDEILQSFSRISKSQAVPIFDIRNIVKSYYKLAETHRMLETHKRDTEDTDIVSDAYLNRSTSF